LATFGSCDSFEQHILAGQVINFQLPGIGQTLNNLKSCYGAILPVSTKETLGKIFKIFL
jgi:hypothetical protein